MNCNFCGNEIPHGKEKIFVSAKGKVFHFCSRKCEKNLLKLKRKPREVKWTKAYREEKEIRIKVKPKEEIKVKKKKEAKEEKSKVGEEVKEKDDSKKKIKKKK
ncbi:MAG: 50S ribosomal protein L24e [Candidatus Altiarchaeota archaeon]